MDFEESGNKFVGICNPSSFVIPTQ